ncbi:aminopeptidase [Oceanobacillus timonensis]|uniref:aminopeptidase n=1 Tax=Oceanobacillus timonensis TaxID=1926285 RepID=UPI0009BABDB0|nr:aminopeptidase [Oceanobacillus timonensis]
MNSFQQTVAKLMKHNVFAEKDAKMLVVTDHSTEALGKKFQAALEQDDWNADLQIMSDRDKSGEEPPEANSEAMLAYDLVFCLTKHSLTHTVARKNANAHGVSVITMPGITEDMILQGAMSADYKRVEKETTDMTAKLTKAKAVTITTGKEKNLKLHIPLEGRDGIASTGIFRGKTASGNLPSGEAYIAPVEGLAEGKIEINGSMAGIGLVDEPVVLTVEKGRLVQATGEQGALLLSLLGEGNGRLAAELGIGTNHAARITGNILEDEKAYETVHVAFGSNHTFGGTNKADVHIDCVTKNPQLDWEFE